MEMNGSKDILGIDMFELLWICLPYAAMHVCACCIIISLIISIKIWQLSKNNMTDILNAYWQFWSFDILWESFFLQINILMK